MKDKNSTFCFFSIITALLLLPNFVFASRGIIVKEKNEVKNLNNLYEQSYALIIGNGEYNDNSWGKLTGAVKDVEEVSDVLRKHGFKVNLKTNITTDTFLKIFREFSIKQGKLKDARLLFYFAGHGFTKQLSNGEDLGYLVMTDTPNPENDPVGFEVNSIDLSSIITESKKIAAKHVLFMFDSCFSGSILNQRDKAVPQSIQDNSILPARQFITAGRSNETVPDQSYFKTAFLDILEGRAGELIPDGYLTASELAVYLQNVIPNYNSVQHPQYGKISDPALDKGDFIFFINNSNVAIVSPTIEGIDETGRKQEELPVAEEEGSNLWLYTAGGAVAVLGIAAAASGGGSDSSSPSSMAGSWNIVHNSSEYCTGTISFQTDNSFNTTHTCPSGTYTRGGSWEYSNQSLRKITTWSQYPSGSRSSIYEVYEGTVNAFSGTYVLNRKDAHSSYTETISR